MNSVNLIGRLTKDPELRSTPSGTSVCSMRIAVDRAGDMVDGEPGAGFFNITAWGKLADNCARFLSRGRQVGVSGELRFHEWEADDGTKRSTVEVNARNVQFIGGRQDGDGEERSSSDQYVPSGGFQDDDIPF